jgi:uridine phosphorylase
MVTQMQNLAHLGTRRFAIVGTAGAITTSLAAGDTVLVEKALRDDGVSQHFLAPAPYVCSTGPLTNELAGVLPYALRGSSWTVAVPFRMTAVELDTYAADGVVAVEMEAAALFAVAEYLGVDSAVVVVITTVTTTEGNTEDWPASTEPLLAAFDEVVAVMSSRGSWPDES